MVRMTEKPCGRCTNKLASSNHNRDHLCGTCQRELGPKGSAAYRAWIEEGRKRAIVRNAMPVTSPEAPITATIDKLSNPDLVTLVREASRVLERRRQEAEALLRQLVPTNEPQRSRS